MSKYRNGELTDQGLDFARRALNGEIKIQFTKGVLSAENHEQDSPQTIHSLTNLNGFCTSNPINYTTPVDNENISVPLRFLNSNMTTNNYVNTVGIYATDGNNEILYSVIINDDPELFPAYNGTTPEAIRINSTTQVGRADQVNVQVSPQGMVTEEEFQTITNDKDHNFTGKLQHNGVDVVDLNQLQNEIQGIGGYKYWGKLDCNLWDVDKNNKPDGYYGIDGDTSDSIDGFSGWGIVEIKRNIGSTFLELYSLEGQWKSVFTNGTWNPWVRFATFDNVNDAIKQVKSYSDNNAVRDNHDGTALVNGSSFSFNNTVASNCDILTLGPGIYRSVYGYQSTLQNFPSSDGSATIVVKSASEDDASGKIVEVIDSWGGHYINQWNGDHWNGWQKSISLEDVKSDIANADSNDHNFTGKLQHNGNDVASKIDAQGYANSVATNSIKDNHDGTIGFNGDTFSLNNTIASNCDILSLSKNGIYRSIWGYQNTLQNFPSGDGAATIIVKGASDDNGSGKIVEVIDSWGGHYVNQWSGDHWSGWQKLATISDTNNAYQNAVNTAKQYTDQQHDDAINNSKVYANAVHDDAVSMAKQYTDNSLATHNVNDSRIRTNIVYLPIYPIVQLAGLEITVDAFAYYDASANKISIMGNVGINDGDSTLTSGDILAIDTKKIIYNGVNTYDMHNTNFSASADTSNDRIVLSLVSQQSSATLDLSNRSITLN